MGVEHPKQLGKYEILSVLGKGGMGIVYKARDVVIDRVVAIKTIVAGSDGIDQEQVKRLLQEARSAGRLHHPNIATVFDYGEEGGISYIVLEYAEGVDLGQVIAANQPLPFPAKVDLLAQICHGLGFAHDNNVVHRDLKPANVRLTPQGIAKIVDFGLARFDDTHLTKTGFISGTIAYMSPERMSGATGKSDDIFALGAVAYELLTYQRAFTGASAPEVMFKIMTQTPPPPSSLAELPPQLDRVILQCLDREPANRFATAYDFATAIEEAVASPEVQQFLNSPERSDEFRNGVQSWTGKGRRRHTTSGVIEALSSSGRLHAGDVPTAGAVAPPTQVVDSSGATAVITSNDATQVVSSSTATRAVTASQSAMTMVDTAPPTRVMAPPTLTDATSDAGAPTEVFMQPAPQKKRSPVLAIGGVAAVVIVAGIIAFTMMRKDDVPPPTAPQGTAAVSGSATPAQTTAEATPSTSTADRARVDRANSELQLLSVRLQSKLDAARSVGVPLPHANEENLLSRIEGLKSAVDNGDVDKVQNEGRRILADADLLIQRQRKSVATGTQPPASSTTTTRPPVTATVAEVRPVPAPQPATPQPPAETRPAPQPQPAPTTPSTADTRGEVTAFIRRVAAAYQNKDADFFREHSARYTDAMGKAIRNSASTRVQLEIESISVSDSDHARVTVQRTDEFGGGAPPATQRLVYVLERQGGAWKILRFERP